MDRHLSEGTAVIGWASARVGALGAMLPEGQTDAGADALTAFRPRDLLQIVGIGKSIKRFEYWVRPASAWSEVAGRDKTASGPVVNVSQRD